MYSVQASAFSVYWKVFFYFVFLNLSFSLFRPHFFEINIFHRIYLRIHMHVQYCSSFIILPLYFNVNCITCFLCAMYLLAFSLLSLTPYPLCVQPVHIPSCIHTAQKMQPTKKGNLFSAKIKWISLQFFFHIANIFRPFLLLFFSVYREEISFSK